MGLIDRFTGADTSASDGTSEEAMEQLAADDPDIRGNSENEGGIFYDILGRVGTGPRRDFNQPSRRSTIDSAIETPPDEIETDFNKYYYGFALVRGALRIFSQEVMEPGIKVSATIETGDDDATDEGMQEALRTWRDNCVIQAGETGKPLGTLCESLVIRRRGKGTQFVEPTGTEANPDILAGLMTHEPSNFHLRKRDHKNLLIQPDDPVPDDHPRTPNDDSGAYVQYPSTDYQAVFAEDELYKFVFDADESRAFGHSIFESIAPAIDRLIQKLEDRDLSIRMTHYPHKIYELKDRDVEEAKEFASAMEEGSLNVQSDDRRGEKETLAGSINMVPGEIDVKVVKGDVPDITSAIMDDVEQIFSILPIAKLQIAYEEDINQFVAEPQREKDMMLIQREREYLQDELLQPLFERKADELAGGDYEGTVSATIEPSEDQNPVMRDNFPAENINAAGGLIKKVIESGAASKYPGLIPALMGFDADELLNEHADGVDLSEIAPEMAGGGEGESGEGGDDDSGDDNPDE